MELSHRILTRCADDLYNACVDLGSPLKDDHAAINCGYVDISDRYYFFPFWA